MVQTEAENPDEPHLVVLLHRAILHAAVVILAILIFYLLQQKERNPKENECFLCLYITIIVLLCLNYSFIELRILPIAENT